jgi:beta-galactosidase
MPPSLSRMNWSRDAYFADYPAGHLGEPTGTCRAGDTLFRSSKYSLHWMTIAGPTGSGLTLLASGETPLVARAAPGATANTLFASREVAGPQDFSGAWVSEHNILATKGKPLIGAFLLRAAGP